LVADVVAGWLAFPNSATLPAAHSSCGNSASWYCTELVVSTSRTGTTVQ